MAPTLTSNSSLLATTPHSRLTIRHQKLRVFAKKSRPFPSLGLGKSKDDSSLEEGEQPSNSNPNNPFRFNFGKLPNVTSLIPVVNNPLSPGLSFGNPRRKDPSTVFVAGATGQAGIRIAQTLLREGFSVRAGVPELGSAQELARLAAQYKIISKEEAKRLNAVQSSFDDADSIAKAIGNASKVVVTIGPTENGPAAEVSTSDALQVVQAAQLAGVGHVAVIYDDSTAPSSTYNVMDGFTSFFNNLFSKSKPLTIKEFLQSVIETDIAYTFIRTSLTDDFSPESSYNVVVLAEGSAGEKDYKVAKSKIASLVADVFSNTQVAENKVVEVYTDPNAPLRRVDELFSIIPEDGRRKAYAEILQKARAEEEARVAAEKASEASEATKKLEEEVKKLTQQEARAASLAQEAQEKAEAAGASVGSLLNKAKDLGAGFSWQKLSSQIATSIQKADDEDEISNVKLATVRGQAKARSLTPNKAVIKQTTPSKAASKPKEEKPKEVRNVFGGLFKQETIFVDED
ncbi:PREDICTED: protein plastid transcriptionally active 16, chloroplastic [Lupinus angustifolius]|uniref:protein plastid transcriptionally active 16, chloroplastic n=1 Tax=Lupinus angustifolius TaxID=3871 RepID=UPI00092F1640|nr:PREDICTED: protein plastid transcriptionally active 16, chloroplastic [Lupinus angustifolius]